MKSIPLVQLGPFLGGVDNINPVRSLSPDTLSEGINIDIDNVGFVANHPGLTTISADATHSLWANRKRDISLFVQGTTLKRNITTPATLRTGLTSGLPMSYEEINDIIYFSNRVILERTDGFAVVSLATDFTNQIAREDRPFKVPMKAGSIIAYYNKRLYTVRGGSIYFSDPLNFASMDERFCMLRVPGNINMFKPVNDGIFLSFGGKTYFMQGTDPATTKFRLIEKLEYAALGQAVEIRKDLSGLDMAGDKVIAWLSEKGICYGTDGGIIVNRSSKKFQITANQRGATSLFRIKNDGVGHLISAFHN